MIAAIEFMLGALFGGLLVTLVWLERAYREYERPRRRDRG